MILARSRFLPLVVAAVFAVLLLMLYGVGFGVAHADPVAAVAPVVAAGVDWSMIAQVVGVILVAIGSLGGIVSTTMHLTAARIQSPGLEHAAVDVDLVRAEFAKLADVIRALGVPLPAAPAPAASPVSVSITNHTVPSDPLPTVTVTPAAAPAAALLTVLLLGAVALQPACATLKADAVATGHQIAACAKADEGPIALELGALTLKAMVSYASTGKIDVDALETNAEADAKTQGVTVAACSFGPLISWIEKLFPPAPAAQSLTAAAGPPVQDPKAALARFKAAVGVTEIRTAAGAVL